jgi:ribulose-5-phosphate 4-epimerase/fuculose-1-phosphate aldolase
MSEAEWAMRCDLAACYRLTALFGWDDLIATHISARVPHTDDFLINPLGLLFEEITASSLVRVDAEGKIVSPTPHAINPAGFVIHSAIHAARPDVMCVMHLHTPDAIAVGALDEGLLPLDQTALGIIHTLAYHAYEGVALELDERVRLQTDLGDKALMLLRNHGSLAVGSSVAEAFVSMYMLERACQTQVRTLAMGRALHLPAQAAQTKVFEVTGRGRLGPMMRELYWPALLRRLDRAGARYKE